MYVDEAPGLGVVQPVDLNSLKLGVILAMRKPEELVAFGNLFLPELAALELKPDGESVKVPQGRSNPTGQSVYVAMSDDRLAATLGGATDERLQGLMNKDANPDAPLLWMEADPVAYLGLYEPLWESLGIMDEALLDEFESLYDRTTFSVRTSKNGLIMSAELKLKKADK
jgi:hypothetical protein